MQGVTHGDDGLSEGRRVQALAWILRRSGPDVRAYINGLLKRLEELLEQNESEE